MKELPRHLPEKLIKAVIATGERISTATSKSSENPKLLIGSAGVTIALLGETIRATLVNQHSNPFGNLNRSTSHLPAPEPVLGSHDTHPLIYGFLQSTGDAMWGYNISFFTYAGLTYVELLARRRIPERLKAGLSVGVSATVITAVETGLMWGTATQSIEDIFGGMLGPASWLGLNYLGGKFRRIRNHYEAYFQDKPASI